MNEQTITEAVKNRILLTEVIPGLFQATSFQWKGNDKNDKNELDRKAYPIVSFLVFNQDKTTCVEWEVAYGPITLYESCGEFYETEEGERLKAGTKHWYLGNCKTNGNWTQLGVYKQGLPSDVVDGDFEAIKTKLMRNLG